MLLESKKDFLPAWAVAERERMKSEEENRIKRYPKTGLIRHSSKEPFIG
jgi:hypothetical protein